MHSLTHEINKINLLLGHYYYDLTHQNKAYLHHTEATPLEG